MPSTVTHRATLNVGRPMILRSPSPSAPFEVAFEDDGTVGYLYAYELQHGNEPVDAVHIYNVASIADADTPSTTEVAWSSDGLKSVLVINRYPHAVFDFEARRGYCRTGFPPSPRDWTKHSHEWDDAAIDLFRS